MKTKTYGSYVYIVKTYFTDSNGFLQVFYETWSLQKRAKEDYQRKVMDYGEDNVFIFKAKQCRFE